MMAVTSSQKRLRQIQRANTGTSHLSPPRHHPRKLTKQNLTSVQLTQTKTKVVQASEKVSREEHLQCAWKPFTWELKDQERDHYQQEFNKFEKATRKRERAAERKRKQRAREKHEKAAMEVSMCLCALGHPNG